MGDKGYAGHLSYGARKGAGFQGGKGVVGTFHIGRKGSTIGKERERESNRVGTVQNCVLCHLQTFEGLGEEAGPDWLHLNTSCLHQSLDLVRLQGHNHVTKLFTDRSERS